MSGFAALSQWHRVRSAIICDSRSAGGTAAPISAAATLAPSGGSGGAAAGISNASCAAAAAGL